MSLLRILGSISAQPLHFEWALLNVQGEMLAGNGSVAELPRTAERVQLVLPAAEVLITLARIPQSARHRISTVLAFAVEEKTASDPDANQVSWLGAVGDEQALAVVDKHGLQRWLEALTSAGLHVDDVVCETLLLPVQPGEWSLAWHGSEGFVRSGEFEGAATDHGDPAMPPLSLKLMLEEAATRGVVPTTLALYTTQPDAKPDFSAWQRELGIAIYHAGAWDWRTAAADAGVSLTRQRQRWQGLAGMMTRLRPAAWIASIALVLHAVVLVADWSLLENDQRLLRQHMETQFRAVFPDAVAVVDPVLQMRRKLAEARHDAGYTDSSDYLPMIGQVAAATKSLPAGTLRAVSYEGGRMTLELAATDTLAIAAIAAIAARLRQSGLVVDLPAAASAAPGATVMLTVQAS